MRDTINLAPTPVGEDCAQLGSADYYERCKKECRAFINQLRRQFGPEPEGARLFVASCPHDFGTYHEVACKFEDTVETAVGYAFKIDAEMPEKWDDQARLELGLDVPPGPGGIFTLGAVMGHKLRGEGHTPGT